MGGMQPQWVTVEWSGCGHIFGFLLQLLVWAPGAWAIRLRVLWLCFWAWQSWALTPCPPVSDVSVFSFSHQPFLIPECLLGLGLGVRDFSGN